MRRAVVLVALVAAGCYSPSPPAGAYLCGEGGGCPSGQHCVCGLCVSQAAEAACAFTVDAKQNGQDPTVGEHQPFPVKITALQADKTTPASRYSGAVTLEFALPGGARWCDVTPATVEMKNGEATVMVQLNRETVSPQQPRLTATSKGGATGPSGRVTVMAPPFVRDPMPVIPPVPDGGSFGWSKQLVALPAVRKSPAGLTMYFVGAETPPLVAPRTAIGAATSVDGRVWTPAAMPVLRGADVPFGGPGVGMASLITPSTFERDGAVSLLFTVGQDVDPMKPGADVGLATSPSGVMFKVGAQPVLQRRDCMSYCADRIDFANVIPDPGVPNGWLMYFAGTRVVRSGTANINQVSIGLAQSTDGSSFVPEPEPVLDGDPFGDVVITAPQVTLDKSVYKMWYTFARSVDTNAFPLDTCKARYNIGYATSTDGRFWVRSPSNRLRPALTDGGSGWDADSHGFLAGSVMKDDGGDGVVLYYSTYRRVDVDLPGLGKTPLCLPNGIGKATRP